MVGRKDDRVLAAVAIVHVAGLLEADLVEKHPAVVHLLAWRHISCPRIPGVIKARAVRQPCHAGGARAFDPLWQQLAGSGFNQVQRAQFGAVGRSAVGNIIAVFGREPPVSEMVPSGASALTSINARSWSRA